MTAIDFFATTVRGLFLAPGGLGCGAREVPLTAGPVPAGAAIAVEVSAVPAGCEVGRLEIIEVLPGSEDVWRTREVPIEAGHRLVVALGGRFANRSINGRAPGRPVEVGSLIDLLNTGGVSGHCDELGQPVVKLRVLGGVARRGGETLLSELWVIPGAGACDADVRPPETPLVLVVGSDMDVGKTTCAASLATSLRETGMRVTFAKPTGTGRMRDLMRVSYGRPDGCFDAGRQGWDFVDTGLATTGGIPEGTVRSRARALLRHAAASGEIVLCELADAPFLDGSLHVASDPWLQTWLRERGLVLCACDTIESTTHTVGWLLRHMTLGRERVLISGKVANQPASRREAERAAGVAAVSCHLPLGDVPAGREAPGAALSDWVLRNLHSGRRAIA